MRTKTYIAADFDHDKDAVDLLYYWKNNKNLSFDFQDAHDLTQARDTSLYCSIKKSLRLRLNESKTFVLIVAVVISQLCFFARIFMLNKMIQLKFILFLKKVYCNVLAVSIIAAFFPCVLCNLFEKGLLCFVLSVVSSLISSLFVIYFIGCNKEERCLMTNKAKSWLRKFKHA